MSRPDGKKSRNDVVLISELESVECPCGHARRAFVDIPGAPCSVHEVTIEYGARAHFHKSHTEVYYVLECGPGSSVELDGCTEPVRPGMAILIRPGVRHRAAGRMRILNIVIPPFDPEDEWE